MGADHAAILAASPLADLAICCDLDPAAASRVPPGIGFTTSFDEALATPGLESLWVCTPQSAHEDGVRRGMAAGLHVFCEKPIADTIAAADAIVALDAAAPGRLVIGHMYRFEPRWRSLRRAVADGRLGRLVHVSMEVSTPDYEGVMLAGRTTLANENAVHGLDLFRWIAGDVDRVYAEASRTGVAGDGLIDSIAVTLRFASGAVGTMIVDWALPTAVGVGLTVQAGFVGSKGIAWYDARGQGVGVLSTEGGTVLPNFLAYADPAGSPSGAYRDEDEFFLQSVRDGRPLAVSAADARAALQVALAVDRSLELGRPVEVREIA